MATLRPPCSEEAKQHRKAIVGAPVSNPTLQTLPTQALGKWVNTPSDDSSPQPLNLPCWGPDMAEQSQHTCCALPKFSTHRILWENQKLLKLLNFKLIYYEAIVAGREETVALSLSNFSWKIKLSDVSVESGSKKDLCPSLGYGPRKTKVSSEETLPYVQAQKARDRLTELPWSLWHRFPRGMSIYPQIAWR